MEIPQQEERQEQPKAYKISTDIQDYIESEYLKIEDGQTRTLEFLPNRTTLENKTDFSGKPTQRAQFIVIDLEREDQRRKEQKFQQLPKKYVRKMIDEFRKDKTVFQITRSGTGINTNYIIKALH
jgi:hypothetical protein